MVSSHVRSGIRCERGRVQPTPEADTVGSVPVVRRLMNTVYRSSIAEGHLADCKPIGPRVSGAARTLGVCTQRYPSARKHEAEQRDVAAHLSDLLLCPNRGGDLRRRRHDPATRSVTRCDSCGRSRLRLHRHVKCRGRRWAAMCRGRATSRHACRTPGSEATAAEGRPRSR